MTFQEKREQSEKELRTQIKWQESKLSDVTSQLKFESDQKNKMAEEIVRLEKLVKSREDYMCNLETEAIMLRKEIKDAKFNNEKQGYNGFVGGLTQLRTNRGRSTSNNRGVDRSAERKPINLSNNNAVAKNPEREQEPHLMRSQVKASDAWKNYQPPSPITNNVSLDARSRLMMSDLSRQKSSQRQHAQPEIQHTFRMANTAQISSAVSPRIEAKSSERRPIPVYDYEEILKKSSQKTSIVS